MARCKFLAAVVALVMLAPAAWAHSPFLKAPTTGDPQIKSIEALTFSSDGLLVIGDGKGAQVVVIDTTHAKGAAWDRTEVKDLAKELAGRSAPPPRASPSRKWPSIPSPRRLTSPSTSRPPRRTCC